MTRPTRFTYSYPQGVGFPGGDPSLPPGQVPVDCCADGDDSFPDRALDQTVFIGVTGGTGALVQSDSTTDGGGGSSLSYPGDTTVGNLLVAVIVTRGGSGQPSTPSGWTLVEHGGKTADWGTAMYWRIAPGGPVTVSFNPPTNEVRLIVMEFDGGGAGVLDAVGLTAGASTSTFTLPSVTVGSTAILVGNVSAGNGVPNSIVYTDDPDYTEVDQGPVGGALDPESITSHRLVLAGTYDFEPTGNHASAYGGALAGFDIGEGWTGTGAGITDGDDATYQTVTGPNVIRIDLGAPFEISRIRLLIGTELAGSRSYTLRRATQPDFSDADTAVVVSWSATGSYTADDLTESWTPTGEYQYWELIGNDEARRVYSFELYEGDNASTGGRWELAVVPGSPPDSLYADGDWLYIFVP